MTVAEPATRPASPEDAPVPPRRRPSGPLLALGGLFVFFCAVYAFQALRHGTPWLFTDELEYAQLSRAIAETGRPELRGEPQSFTTLAPFLTAPAWLAGDTHTGYALAKLIGVVLMTATMLPAYALARMVARPWPAVFAAAGAVAVPALSYSSMLLEEPIAYPAATLGLLCIAKALATRTRWWIAAAVAASLLAFAVRTQLSILFPTAALAVLGLAWASPAARRWRARWTWREWVGAVVLAVGIGLLVGQLIGDRSQSWTIAMHFRGRLVEYGLWAFGALAIGIGVLPVLLGLAALSRPRGELRTPALRAFVAVSVSALVVFALYTGIKAAYLSTTLTTRVSERNLVYVTPLLFAAAALWLDRPRLRAWALLLAGAFVTYLMWATPYQLETRFYGDAPGLAVLSTANRHLQWTPGDVRTFLVALAIVALAVVAARAWGRLRARAVAVALAVVCVGWGFTAEVAASRASNGYSGIALQSLPKPLDWIDRATGGASTIFLGQQITDANGVWQEEFWNRSIDHMWSLDATAHGPGPVLTPDLHALDGELYPPRPDVRYVVADQKIDLVGTAVARGGPWVLYRIDPPLRLRAAEEGIYADGWIGTLGAYHQFSTPGNRPGWVSVTVGRLPTHGRDVPGNVTVAVGTLRIGEDKQPHMGAVTAEDHWVVRNGKQTTLVLPTPPPPFRVQVYVDPTFVPAEIDPKSGDVRHLGAQVSFAYSSSDPR